MRTQTDTSTISRPNSEKEEKYKYNLKGPWLQKERDYLCKLVLVLKAGFVDH